MRLRVSGAVVLAALVVVAAGCGGDPEPILAPTLSASSTTSVSPSPSESEVAEETPEEFVERWVQLSNEMQQTGETEAYLAASRGCASCESVAQTIAGIYDDGGRVDTDGWKILSTTTINSGKRSAIVESRVYFDRTRSYDSSGRVMDRFPAGEAKYQFSLMKSDEEWVLHALAQVAA